MRGAGLVVIAVLALGHPAAAQDYEKVQSMGAFFPFVIQDANVADPGFQIRFGGSNLSARGRVGTNFFAKLTLGLPWNQEVSVSDQISIIDGRGDARPVSIATQWEFLQETSVRPLLTVLGAFSTATRDSGVSGDVGLLVTKTFARRARVHFNAIYSARVDASDRYLVGFAGDYSVTDRLLLAADAYLAPQLDQVPNLGADFAANVRAGRSFIFQGAVGFERVGSDYHPRFFLGITSHM